MTAKLQISRLPTPPFRVLIIYVIVVGIVSLNCKIGEFVCNNDYIRRQKEAKGGKRRQKYVPLHLCPLIADMSSDVM